MTASQKIATEDIYVSRGVKAFSKGQVVPASVVENLGIQDKVSGVNTQAAKAVIPTPPKPQA